MSVIAWTTVLVLLLVIVALAREIAAVEVVMLGALTLLMLTGAVSPQEALQGFGSPAVITIGALFVVASAIRRTGALTVLASSMFGPRPKTALLRMLFPSAAMSTFLNNTPIVAMLTPAILDWCKRFNKAPSRMLMPLSFATILGGMCSVIGTSTNLVLDGMMRERGLEGMGFFEIGQVGLPIAFAGVLLIGLTAAKLLPDRRDPVSELDASQREFLVEMLVDRTSPLIGKTVREAGMRQLPGLFLITIERQGQFLGAVRPIELLRAGDRLVFAGLAATVVDLRRFPGLSPAPEAHYDPLAAERRRFLYEAVVSQRSPLLGRTIKDAGFRSYYDAAVIAVHRAGHRLAMKIGEVEVRAGDTLMLEAEKDFDRRWTDSPDFALISRVRAEPHPEPRKAPLALLILSAMVATVTLNWIPMAAAALGAACAMIMGGVLDAREARKSIDLSVLITVGAAMGLGQALDRSGVAQMGGEVLNMLGATIGLRGVLAASFIAAVLLNSVVTNVAAAAIVLPVALASAEQLALDPRPVAFMVAIASSASFLTPTAYQTNLMVYGPGGYRFSDFARLGTPLLLLVFLISLWLVPLTW